jgi:hypothetical protein
MDEAPQNKPFMKKLQEKIAASRFLSVSLLLHAIIVILGGSVVLFKAYVEPPDFEAQGGGLVGDDAPAAPQDEPQEMANEVFTPDQPTVSAPTIEAITTTSTLQTSFKMSSMPTPVKTVEVGDMAKSMASAAKSALRGAGGGVPGSMSGRMGGTARANAMRQLGGKEKAEKAVMAGLRWLKKTQNEDGSWSDQNRPAMTGFAILCFLGHGELPDSPEFGPTVKKGVDWLLAKGTEFQGNLSMNRNGWGGNHGVYEHAIAAYAISEYYTMSKDERFADLVKQAITHIVQGQDSRGGWQYQYTKGTRTDTSVSGWQIQALKAAHLTGLGIPGVDEALDKSMLMLKSMQGEDGSFGYLNPPGKYSLTGVGVLCTYFWKQDKDRSVRDGIEYMLRMTEDKYPVKYKSEHADLYAWYYNTQACLMFGGSAWSKWNRWFQDEICDAQSPDGSWPPTGGKGHAENDPGIRSQTYRTTLCILMLEVFYRYMPINK